MKYHQLPNVSDENVAFGDRIFDEAGVELTGDAFITIDRGEASVERKYVLIRRGSFLPDNDTILTLSFEELEAIYKFAKKKLGK